MLKLELEIEAPTELELQFKLGAIFDLIGQGHRGGEGWAVAGMAPGDAADHETDDDDSVLADDESDADGGPEEGDYVTADYVRWAGFGTGKVFKDLVTGKDGTCDDDWAAQVVAHQRKHKYYPNAWFLGERGDYNLLVIDEKPDGTVAVRGW